MKNFILTLLILSTSLCAELKNEYLSKKLIDSKIPIVDIRTVGEWKETGILRGSIALEFFNEKGEYNIPLFLKELNKKVDTTKPFALICRTGSRTSMVSAYLVDTYNYKVTNVKGGIMIHNMKKENMDFVQYK
ncbi:MAG: rhodanese-like domain-containing protein [Sulfurimonas sp.]|nr:rhodanese-like domain-containing protein [Sulfurimonas sp.]MDQ7060777.1 rhodanese-like domain-containing protein [Sulfurimonas sp.]